jgi:hypothetical protein
MECTCEHSLQLVGVLDITGLLELGNHTSLALVRCGYTVNEALRQFRGIESLEDVLVFDVPEKHHLQRG